MHHLHLASSIPFLPPRAGFNRHIPPRLLSHHVLTSIGAYLAPVLSPTAS